MKAPEILPSSDMRMWQMTVGRSLFLICIAFTFVVYEVRAALYITEQHRREKAQTPPHRGSCRSRAG